ncbi:MAG: hypothetical protein U5K38_06545 [Woeseiaceae bacterium]|nr:hypothetical protein [Woeseiaceae bacterium]
MATEPPDISVAGPIFRVDFASALFIDQCHRTARSADLLQEIVIDARQHIDDRVTDSQEL